jgi:hypothetical protein
MKSAISLFLSLPILLAQCQNADQGNEKSYPAPDVDQAFRDYWYAGKAELSRYELHQRRYGEMRKGNAIMVFVTEPFLVESQVKKDRKSDEPATKVLKLNYTKDFVTGIYDYHMMTSVFDPIAQKPFDHALKLTLSSQDWCGQGFMQLNNRDDGFAIQNRSYFQSEGDLDTTIGKVLMEDELWTRIRVAPEELPEGERDLLPSSMSIRLLHQGIGTRTAELSKFEPTNKDSIYPGKKLTGYKVHYQDPERIIRILYEKEFPHRIAGWEEHTIAENGKKQLRVRAIRTHQIRSPYWEKNAKKFREMREKLGLE